ncbi:MAG: Crp/Fnr family transcriptional regulator [Dehalococcoidales bacterium]|nr:Crp/Fnr family transcriptional regulator [Dehalococcoidales bacterium]
MVTIDSRPYLRLPLASIEARRCVYQAIESHATLSHWPAHRAIYGVGDEVRAVYAVASGLLKTCGCTPDGHSYGAAPVFPGEPIALAEACTGITHFISAVTLTPATIWTLDVRRFSQLLDDVTFERAVLKLLAGRLLQFTNQTENFSVLSASARLAQLILRSAVEMGRPEGGHVVVEPFPTQEDIADLVGVTRPFATRLLGELEGEGLVEIRRKHLRVLDIPRLQEVGQLERRVPARR